MLFSLLMPLLKNATVNIVLTSEGDKIRAIIMPVGKEGGSSALSTPLSVLASPQELDAELPNVLAKYCEARTSLEETIANTTAILDAAKKAESQKVVKAQNPANAVAQACEGGDVEEEGDEEGENSSVESHGVATKSDSLNDLSLF